MRTLPPVRAGLAFGAVISLWHMVWSVMVLFGWAQPILDFVFWIHFLTPVYVVGPFDAGRAGTLVALTFAFGFVLAWVFAQVWNWLVRPRLATLRAPAAAPPHKA
jgi:hypothetical protein